jgi:hypothetical protein
MILFFILLVAGISTYFKYFSEYEKAIDKFVFIASTVRFIIIFLIPISSNAGTNNIVVIWVLYLAAILFYFIKDEEYEFSYFILFIGANTIGSIIVFNAFEDIYLLSMNSIIGSTIAGIFFVIMTGLTSGFFYQFFKKICINKKGR